MILFWGMGVCCSADRVWCTTMSLLTASYWNLRWAVSLKQCTLSLFDDTVRPSGLRPDDPAMYISLASIVWKRLRIFCLFMRQLLLKLEHSQVQDGRIGRFSRSQTCVVSVSRNSPPFHTCSHSGLFPPLQVSPVWMIKYSSTETLEYRLLWSSTPSTPASLWPTRTASGQGRRAHTPGKHQQL